MTDYTSLPLSVRDTQKRIEAAIETLLEDAKGWDINARGEMGAVNWTDLDVIDVVYSVGLDGEVWYTVEISEAAPDCHELHRYVYENLSKSEFQETIQVRTEW